MSEAPVTVTTGVGHFPGATAGALLGAAREASGLSVDAVAQQLKLAPRQVRALEAGDFGRLPGRTFVRGFIRNYARLMNLDPEQVLKALPAGAATPALEAPTLQPTAPTMGELPTTEQKKARWTRWAIPLTLAAVVAAAAVYEWGRPAGSPRSTAAKDAGVVPDAPAAAPVTDKNDTPLANPFAGAATGAQPSSSGPSGTVAPAPVDAKVLQ